MPRPGGDDGDGSACVDGELGDSAVWTISPRVKDDAPRWEDFPWRGVMSISVCRRFWYARRCGRRAAASRSSSGIGVLIRLRPGVAAGVLDTGRGGDIGSIQCRTRFRKRISVGGSVDQWIGGSDELRADGCGQFPIHRSTDPPTHPARALPAPGCRRRALRAGPRRRATRRASPDLPRLRPLWPSSPRLRARPPRSSA
jgi:hypothetical protein